MGATSGITSRLINQVRQTLTTHNLLPHGHRVLIALSGGQDSLTLSEILLHIQRHEARWPKLSLAHCDHRWPLDVGTSRHVTRYAASVSLPLHHLDVADEETPVAMTECAARDWRYASLGRLALSDGFDDVVTGHTMSDVAETVVHSLVRGAGADGVSGLRWARRLEEGVCLVRPLLGVARRETEMFCEENGVVVWKDAYNEDLRYARNRIRAEVIPVLKRHLNGRVEEALARTACLLREDSECLERIAEGVFERLVRVGEVGGEMVVRVDRGLAEVEVAVQRRVVRLVFRKLGMGRRAKMFGQVEAVRELLKGSVGEATASLLRRGSARIVDEDWVEIRVAVEEGRAAVMNGY